MRADYAELRTTLNEERKQTAERLSDREKMKLEFQALSQEIKAAGAGDYYDHWLHALEHLVVRKQVTTQDRLYEVRDAWERAAHATPHGQPIDLASNPAARRG